jgi:hypothetical protein
MAKIAAQMILIPALVVLWLTTLAAVGVEVRFSNGTQMRLRSWWRE